MQAMHTRLNINRILYTLKHEVYFCCVFYYLSPSKKSLSPFSELFMGQNVALML